MHYLKEILNSKSLEKIINLPDEFKNRKVEVFITKIDDEKNTNSSKSLYGLLNNYSNPKLYKKEKEAWTLVVKENYGNS